MPAGGFSIYITTLGKNKMTTTTTKTRNADKTIAEFAERTLEDLDAKIATVRTLLQGLGMNEDEIQTKMETLCGVAARPASSPPPPAVADETLLTPKELCEKLKINRATLWRMKPPFIGVGRRKRFLWSEVMQTLGRPHAEVALA